MVFTKKTDYALRLMQDLGRNRESGPLSISSIIRGSDMTLKFVQSVARDLSRNNLINTKSGPKGGLTLAKRPSQISVLEIIEAVEGKINIMDCLEHPEICDDYSGCSHHVGH